ncbi:MAG: adenylate kinase family protein [Nitrososphaerota archaeon]|nr:adenylate kinase family protein [Candidatus Bathyarchaeota archaeon]MDW8048437.1 adenylate kinase family protein [Nitrososphaerota archaeon]
MGEKEIRRVIIVTGTPGVGKSSVSAALAERINAHHISLGRLVTEERLYTGLDKDRDTLIADLDRVSERVRKILNEVHGDIIIEGHYAVDVVDPKNVHMIFVLRRDPEELTRVLKNRNYNECKIKENVAAEILDVCLYEAVNRCGLEKVCEVNMTGKNVNEAVEEIIEILEGKREKRVGIVDWLGKLEAEDKLDEYLKDI